MSTWDREDTETWGYQSTAVEKDGCYTQYTDVYTLATDFVSYTELEDMDWWQNVLDPIHDVKCLLLESTLNELSEIAKALGLNVDETVEEYIWDQIEVDGIASVANEVLEAARMLRSGQGQGQQQS